ncbi:pyrroline-5-carboxylate reductase [Propionibacterium cyclohexanicum]|uniref:Pyrroline-5-carboxylate reductase n=1 Tax=Propionibacterium cyclohexanicum TaxID=64702 RepID=A0A1H9RZT3_9ACTN|nr:pyrroline-5-carboxylate reductase [Propionibacterium cyclohexanicum]SER77885.1 pyrroline-5-carboxylate reductase [Propionibacterium cyclohexanicum]
MSYRLGIIGFGNMGGAIGAGLVTNKALPASKIVAWDVSAAALERAGTVGIRTAAGIAELCVASDIVLLAVKPQDASAVVGNVAEHLAGKAVITIVAGLTTDSLARQLPAGTRVLRALPDTPAQVAEGAFGLSEATTITADEKADIEGWLNTIGLVEWVPEEHMDAVTGLAGASAYAAIMIEALADGGVQQGLRRPAAQRLAAQVVLGTAKLLLVSGDHPGQLKDDACSPAGTTLEGIRALERAGFRSALIEAVIAGSQRAREL